MYYVIVPIQMQGGLITDPAVLHKYKEKSMDNRLLKILLIIESLDAEQLQKVKTWVEYNIKKHESSNFVENANVSP